MEKPAFTTSRTKEAEDFAYSWIEQSFQNDEDARSCQPKALKRFVIKNLDPEMFKIYCLPGKMTCRWLWNQKIYYDCEAGNWIQTADEHESREGGISENLFDLLVDKPDCYELIDAFLRYNNDELSYDCMMETVGDYMLFQVDDSFLKWPISSSPYIVRCDEFPDDEYVIFE